MISDWISRQGITLHVWSCKTILSNGDEERASSTVQLTRWPFPSCGVWEQTVGMVREYKGMGYTCPSTIRTNLEPRATVLIVRRGTSWARQVEDR